MVRKVVGGGAVAAGLATAAIVGLGVVGAEGKDGATAAQAPARFVDVDVFAEVNRTDGDAALQLRLSAEDNWRRVALRDPKGRTVLSLAGSGSLRRQGLIALDIESGERTFDELSLSKFKARFPRGRYTFRGSTLGGRRIVGSARLSHSIPAGGRITAPAANSTIDPTGLVVRWNAGTLRGGGRVAAYEVVLAADESDRELTMILGPGARSAEIPDSFLERGQGYFVEVIAVGENGNKSIREIAFKTRS